MIVDSQAAREALLRSLARMITDQRVLDAIARVPREDFVPEALAPMAYLDQPLEIGHGQTISQPRMVGFMLEELRLKGHETVLEIGSGSGYQAALLALLAKRVVTVEVVPELKQRAESVIETLGYKNVEVLQASDELGWRAGAPYDAIIVAAAAPRVPQPLVDQLAPGGRLVIPVGSLKKQALIVVEQRPEGVTVMRKGGCRFVPLIGRDGFPAPVQDSYSS